MRLAVVADIHGSLVALEAVVADLGRRGVDRVLHAGDLALMGSQPAEVVDRIRELGWDGVAGECDELLWRPELLEQRLRAERRHDDRALRLLFETYRPHTLELLGEERVAWLRSLPRQLRAGEVRVVHASPGNLWRAPAAHAPDAELAATYTAAGVSVAAYGHIHRAFVRRVDQGLTVAGCGSAGLPWDGDRRAAYLLIEDGEAATVRVEYDVQRECALMAATGHPDRERIAGMRWRGRYAPPG